MNAVTFAISLFIIVVVFLSRHNIVLYFRYNYGKKIESEWIVYICFALFVMVILAGMLLDDPKEKYANISENYKNLRPDNAKRPHRYFDINTYW
jgi:hypothetical protein